MSRPRALGALESTFIHLEHRGWPLHIASVGIFEGAGLTDDDGHVRIDAIRARIEERLDFAPQLRRRVQHPVLPGAPPLWVDDEDFDVARHVDVVRLDAPGEDRQLWELASRLLAEPLPRAHPLWHLRFVEGLAGERVGVVERIHHALADGLGGVEIALVLFDVFGTVPVAVPAAGTDEVAGWRPEPPPSGLLEAGHDLVRLGEIGWSWAERARQALGRPVATLRSAARLGTAGAVLAGEGVLRVRSSLNRPIGPERRTIGVRFDLGEVRAAAHSLGVKTNDLALTAVGGAVARLAEARGERPPSSVQVLVPVGLSPTDRHNLGNKVSVWFVRVPTGPVDPVARVRAVAAASGRARAAHEELAAEALLELAAALPQVLYDGVARVVDHQLLFNLIVTNVPGPPQPLSLLGARLLEVYPFVPIAGNLTVGVALVSYDHQLAFGIQVDPRTCPDADVFVAGLTEDMERLFAAAARAERRRLPPTRRTPRGPAAAHP